MNLDINPNDYPTLPLRANEANKLLQLHFLEIATRESLKGENLQKRLEAVGEMENFQRLYDDLHRINQKLYATLSEERWNYLQRYSRNNAMYIKPNFIKKSGTSEDYFAVRRKTIVKVMGDLQKQHCDFCLGTDEDTVHCPIRNCIKEIAMLDTDEHEESHGKCIGKLVFWESDD